jgi:hypothetical protein
VLIVKVGSVAREPRHIVQTLLQLLKAIADMVWSVVGTVFGHFFSEQTYREGFLAGMATVFLVGGASYVIGWAWALVNNFFAATRAPPRPATGPIPFRLGVGCAGGAAILVLVALLALSLLSSRMLR